MNRNILSLTYFAFSAGMSFFSYLFTFTNGLADFSVNAQGQLMKNQDLFYISQDIMSSGHNDNICVEIGLILFAIPAIFKLIRIGKTIDSYDYFVFLIPWIIQLFFIYLIEVGSIRITIFYDHNIILAIWTVLFLTSFPIITLLKIKNPQHKTT